MVKQTLEEELEGAEFGDILRKSTFIYEELCKDGSKYELSETIPKEIFNKGEQAVMEYAAQKLREAKKGWKELEYAKDVIRKNPIPIQTEYDTRTLLEGRIIEATSSYIVVELDKPLKNKWYIRFGMASAMFGHQVFTKNNKLSKHAYNAAYRCLYNAYENALRKPEKALMDRLNKKLGN